MRSIVDGDRDAALDIGEDIFRGDGEPMLCEDANDVPRCLDGRRIGHGRRALAVHVQIPIPRERREFGEAFFGGHRRFRASGQEVDPRIASRNRWRS